jgi:hypothetical protein
VYWHRLSAEQLPVWHAAVRQPTAAAVLLARASYLGSMCPPQSAQSAHGNAISVDPVSVMTVNFCGGVPTYTSA